MEADLLQEIQDEGILIIIFGKFPDDVGFANLPKALDHKGHSFAAFLPRVQIVGCLSSHVAAFLPL